MPKLDSFLERKAQAMQERRADWTANPTKAVATIKASSKVGGITGTRPTRMGDYIIISDSAPALAGHALGPTSPEMLLGALGSCLVHTYLIQAVLLNLPLDHIEIEISGTLDYKPVIGMDSPTPPMITDIRYNAMIESLASQQQINNLHAAVELNCPVLNTLRFPVNVQRSG